MEGSKKISIVILKFENMKNWKNDQEMGKKIQLEI